MDEVWELLHRGQNLPDEVWELLRKGPNLPDEVWELLRRSPNLPDEAWELLRGDPNLPDEVREPAHRGSRLFPQRHLALAHQPLLQLAVRRVHFIGSQRALGAPVGQ